LAPGKAVITPGFNCTARHIIHTVGPVWGCCSHNEPELLASCYEQSLLLAERHGLKSVAFPAVSCGAYGYPEQLAAPVALGALRQGLLENKVEAAFLYLYAHKAFEQWTSLAGRLFGPPTSESASA
jgi:O-acetyl-ADP-ribose deacetylase